LFYAEDEDHVGVQYGSMMIAVKEVPVEEDEVDQAPAKLIALDLVKKTRA